MDETQMQPVAPGGIGEMGSPEQAAFYQAGQKADPRQLAQDTLSVARELDPRSTDQFVEQLRALNLPPEVIDALIMMVDALLKDPQNYAKNRQELLDGGVPPELLPEQFDPQFLGAMKIGLQGLDNEPEVQAFAKGGIVSLKPIAREMAKMGRGGDKHLVHVNDYELKKLKAMGGVGTINPYTGLQEFGLFKSIGKAISNVGKSVSNAVSSVGNAVKSFASSTVGKIVLTVAIGALAGPALAGYLGVSSAAGVAGISAALGSGGATLLGGGSLKDAIKAAALSGALAYGGTGLIKGFDTPYGTTPPPSVTDTGNARDTLLARGDVTGGTGTPADLSAGAPDAVVPAPTAPSVGQLATENVTTPGTVNARDALLARPIDAAPPVDSGGIMNARDALLARSPEAFTPVDQLGLSTSQTAAGFSYGPNGELLTSAANQPLVTVPSAPDVVQAASTPQPGFLDQLTSGDITGAAKTGYRNIMDFYTGSSPTIDARNAEAMKQFGSNYMSLSDANQAIVDKALAPTFGTGTKLAATGLGAAYIGGAFKPEAPPQPGLVKGPTGEELLAQDPSKYMPSIFAGQTPVSYATVNPQYYAQRSYGNYNPSAYRPMFSGVRFAAKGGYQAKGIESLSKFPRKTGQISGPGTETSDSIPAKLSDGEFVMTARAVRGMGNGSRRLGAKRMYQLMAALEKRSKGKA